MYDENDSAASSKQSGKLQGISVFKDLRSEAEAKIYEQLDVKIDELLDFGGWRVLLIVLQINFRNIICFLSVFLFLFLKKTSTGCFSSRRVSRPTT